MTHDEFKKLQQTQLEIMDEIHRICTENGIVYYMIGGTALGAVRHGGFIPWDLDIDIAMKRADYDLFKKICTTQLNERFMYRDYTNTSNYDHPHALVCIKNTVLISKFDVFNPEQENLGIYLDIFPLDNAPDDAALQQKQKHCILNISKTKRFKVGRCYHAGRLKRLAKKTVSTLMFWTSVDALNAKLDACMRQYNSQPTGYLCSMASHYSYEKQCMPEEIYGEPQLIAFEGRAYYAPAQLDDYLKRIFKDYMKLPPEEERQANLDVFKKVVFDK